MFSLGNLWVHLKGIEEVRRRVHVDNALRNWLLLLGGIQVNTWVWSTIFHSRGTCDFISECMSPGAVAALDGAARLRDGPREVIAADLGSDGSNVTCCTCVKRTTRVGDSTATI